MIRPDPAARWRGARGFARFGAELIPVVEIADCPPERRIEALGLLYHRIPVEFRSTEVTRLAREAELGRLDLSGLRVALKGRKLVGAILTQALAGRAAAFWAPEVSRTFQRAWTAAELVRASLDHYRARGFRVAQALVDEDAPRRAGADLARGGMPMITRLTYFERETELPLELPENRPRFDWVEHRPENDAEFRRVLEATYEGSLDMPEFEVIRTLDDVLESRREAGLFRPSFLRLGRLPGEPESAAILLLSLIPDRDAWEIAYLGLTPSARGRGLGRAVVSHAIELARREVKLIETAADARNFSAQRLYVATGFSEWTRRAVHFRVLA